MKIRLPWLAFGVLWFGGVVAGLAGLAGYANGPGATGAVPATWPAESTLARATDRPTLLVFVHPRCACSQATIAELAELLARAKSPPATCVAFVRPAGTTAGWERSDLWRAAERIAAATVRVDEGGAEARRFGARTSGQALLYGADGRLLFAGGLTVARGHPGASAGRAAILALLSRETPAVPRAPVFGCELFERDPEGPPDDRCPDCRAAR